MIVIPSPLTECPAKSALRTEGVECRVLPCLRPHDYSRWLARLWDVPGGDLIIVEWDIAPWPGAMKQLADCRHDVCALPYHNGGFPGGVGVSLGCIKFSERYRSSRTLPEEISHTRWEDLDTVFWKLMNPVDVHVHQPGVAHCRRPYDG